MSNGNNKIGQFIKNRRLDLGLTQAELAKALGYSLPNFISSIENGKARFPIGNWREYADALNLDRGRFLIKVLKEVHPEMLDYLMLRDRYVSAS